MTDLLNAKIIATREDILNAIAAAPNRHEAVQNSKLCQPYIPIINRFIDGYHHPRTALDFKTILFTLFAIFKSVKNLQSVLTVSYDMDVFMNLLKSKNYELKSEYYPPATKTVSLLTLMLKEMTHLSAEAVIAVSSPLVLPL